VATLLQNSVDGGVPGSNVTSANSGGSSGSAFTQVVWNNASVGTTGNAGITYATSTLFGDSLVVRINAGSNDYIRWDASDGGRCVVGFPLVIPAGPDYPNATDTIATIRNSTGNMGAFITRTDGKVAVQDATAATVTASISASALAAGVYYVELGAAKGTGTNNGTLEYRVYDLADYTTPVLSWTSSAQNAGTTDPAQARFYGPVTGTAYASRDFGKLRALFTSDTSAWLGPFAATPPDAVFAVTGPFYLIDGTGSTGDNPLTYATEESTATGKSIFSIATGKWLAAADAVAATFTGTVTDTSTTLTDSVNVDVPVVSGGDTSNLIRETIKIAGVWQ